MESPAFHLPETAEEEWVRVSEYLSASPEEQAVLRVMCEFDTLFSQITSTVQLSNPAATEELRQRMCSLAKAHPEEHEAWIRSKLSDE
jgi:hypothetical protein